MNWTPQDRAKSIRNHLRGGLLVLVGALMLPSALTALAQGTPTAAELDVPAPEECQVAPREFPMFPAGVGQRAPATPRPLETPPAAPFVPPSGDPADAETVAAVNATVREALACRNAGDYLRAYALFTEKMIVELFGGPATVDPEVRSAVVDGTRQLPRGRRIGLVSVTDVTALPDGRIGALVETRTARRVFRDYLFFAKDAASDRWLIDETAVMGDG